MGSAMQSKRGDFAAAVLGGKVVVAGGLGQCHYIVTQLAKCAKNDVQWSPSGKTPL